MLAGLHLPPCLPFLLLLLAIGRLSLVDGVETVFVGRGEFGAIDAFVHEFVELPGFVDEDGDDDDEDEEDGDVDEDEADGWVRRRYIESGSWS